MKQQPIAAQQPVPARVVIADDHELARAGLRSMLEGDRGLALVGEATNGVEAISLAMSQRPDVIVMDVSMPQMDGMEATRRIRATEAGTGRRVPIVAVTANAMEADREACFDAGMDDFLTKPVMMESLRAVLDRFVLGIGEEPKATPASSAP